MNRELEELVKAMDAMREARNRADYLRRKATYEAGLDAVISRRPGVGRQALDKAVTLQYRRWIASQGKPPTMPPHT
ncbi:MAG: hypothetical protein C5B50_29395 [Verrucomicrobia bacterium]|nr:MAG: hypothetical protein C5B50_29395 [Verrucomicrobiota bacterium]